LIEFAWKRLPARIGYVIWCSIQALANFVSRCNGGWGNLHCLRNFFDGDPAKVEQLDNPGFAGIHSGELRQRLVDRHDAAVPSVAV
jgi:hypothetical protein